MGSGVVHGTAAGRDRAVPRVVAGACGVDPEPAALEVQNVGLIVRPFLVLLHLGTATALLIIYRQQWVAIIRGFFTAAFRGQIKTDSERLSMLLLVGTIPAGILGVFLEHALKALFANPKAAAAFLLINGFLMLGAEILRRRAERKAAVEGKARVEQEERFEVAEHISFRAAALVGAIQALALLPGISRSGVTIAGGLLAGLRHQEAARFSFLLATPIIAAAPRQRHAFIAPLHARSAVRRARGGTPGGRELRSTEKYDLAQTTT